MADTRDFEDRYLRRWRETYYFPAAEGDVTLAACFECTVPRDSQKVNVELGCLERLTTKRGLPVTYERYNNFCGGHYLRFEYTYSAGRITGVRTAEYGGYSSKSVEYAGWKVSYDPDGEISAIEHADKGRCAIRWPYYRNPVPVTLDELAERMASKFSALIIAAVGKIKIRGRVFSLVLGYSSEGELSLPPYIGLGLEQERADWIKEYAPKDLKTVLWNPEEYEHQASKHKPLLLDDPEVETLMNQIFERAANRNPIKLTQKILYSVAKQLADHRWGDDLTVTDDFVVTACDVEAPDRIAKEMKASVPADLIKQFKKQGWA